MTSPRMFDRGQLEALAHALADVVGGLTHSEITGLLHQHGLLHSNTTVPKWQRLFNAFAQNQNFLQSNHVILRIVEHAVHPLRFVGRQEDYRAFRESMNRYLLLLGLSVEEDERLLPVVQARTLSDAERRARELRGDLSARGVHTDVLQYCRADLIVDDYFHAVLEASKGITHKLRERTGLQDDGSVLVDRVFGGDQPILVINSFKTRSERMEQTGFVHLLKGMYGMFRNPPSHEPRIYWPMTKSDAEDILSLMSLIHRRIDGTMMPPRIESH